MGKPIFVFEEQIKKANEEFEKWRRNLILREMKRFKPLDPETRQKMEKAGLEYDEDLSALLTILIEG